MEKFDEIFGQSERMVIPGNQGMKEMGGGWSKGANFQL